MRIGVAGDPGLTALLSGKEGGELILPPAWKTRLTMTSARTNPTHNIQAGIGYLLMRAARFEYRDVIDNDARIFEVTVKAGDSLDKIAHAQRSTVDVLKALNPDVGMLQPGQKLKCQRATHQKVIVGWRPVNASMIADRCNAGGDTNYAKKFEYVWAALHEK